MIAEAILDLNFQRKCSFWASRSQNFACGACNGYVTVRKRFVFVFYGGGPSPSEGAGGRPLSGRSKTLAPGNREPQAGAGFRLADFAALQVRLAPPA